MEWKVSKRINHSSTYDSISYLLVINIPNNFGKTQKRYKTKQKMKNKVKLASIFNIAPKEKRFRETSTLVGPKNH
ncbi:hypothetical protein LINPERHAP1_LOCUS806 [Linum perenne]